MTVCVFCNGPVDAQNDYRRVKGWERKNQHGARKGGSDIVCRERGDEWACRWCVERQRRGVSLEQESLL